MKLTNRSRNFWNSLVAGEVYSFSSTVASSVQQQAERHGYAIEFIYDEREFRFLGQWDKVMPADGHGHDYALEEGDPVQSDITCHSGIITVALDLHACGHRPYGVQWSGCTGPQMHNGSVYPIRGLRLDLSKDSGFGRGLQLARELGISAEDIAPHTEAWMTRTVNALHRFRLAGLIRDVVLANRLAVAA